MGEIYDAVVQFFTQDEWPFTELSEGTVLRVDFQGDSGQWVCYAQAREAEQQLAFYSVCQAKAPQDKRPALAEFLTRANYDLPIGNFEINLDDGTIRFKTSIDVEGDRLSPALVQQIVYANVTAMDRYLPGIMAVLYGGVSAIDAIRQIEG